MAGIRATTIAEEALTLLAVSLLVYGVILGTPAVAQPHEQSHVAAIRAIMNQALGEHHLKSIIVQVRIDGKNIYAGALGDSMTGVKATPTMHFRGTAMAFTYMSTMLLELVDKKEYHSTTNSQRFSRPSRRQSDHPQELGQHDVRICRLRVPA